MNRETRKNLNNYTEQDLVALIKTATTKLKKSVNKKAKNVLIPIGDDAAVYNPRNKNQIASTDILIENTHFKLEWTTGYNIGWRAITQNVSDIAAMGGTPNYILISLGLDPKKISNAFFLDFLKGVIAACKFYNVLLIGGDLSYSKNLVVAVSIIGENVAKKLPILLQDMPSKSGNLFYIGELGYSYAGYQLLDADINCSKGKIKKTYTKAITDYLRPTSPLDDFLKIRKMLGKNITSCTDLSDGLLKNINFMAKKNNLSVDLKYESLVDKDLLKLAEFYNEKTKANSEKKNSTKAEKAKHKHDEWIFCGGEEHGFLFTVKDKISVEKVEKMGAKYIGVVENHANQNKVTRKSKTKKAKTKGNNTKESRITVNGKAPLDIENLSAFEHFAA